MAARVITVKFKRPKISAVRDFPVGCGPAALPVAGRKRPADDFLAAAAEAPEPVLQLKEPKVEPVESGGVAKGTNLELPNGPEPPEVAPETSKGGLAADPACVKWIVQVNQKRCYPMFYPPPKRRKVSCVRDYPAGCGPNAPVLIRGEGLEVIAAADAPSASNVGNWEKLPLEAVKVDAFVGAAPVQKVGIKLEQGDSEQIHGDLKGNSSEAQRKPASDHLNSKDMDSGEKPPVKKQLVVEGTIKVNSTGRSEGEAKSNGAKHIGEKFMSKGVGVEKKPLGKQPQKPEGSIKVASAEKSQEEATRKNAESIREKAREMSNDDQLKCAPKSSLREKAPVKSASKSSLDGGAAGERRENVPTGSTSQKRLEGHGEKQLHKIIRVKEEQESEPSLDAKSQFGNENVKDGKQSVGQVVGRGLVKYEPEVGKWQVATSQTEEHSGLVVHGDRMVVQALMAASNCPWSQGRKPGGLSSHSVTPKSNVKKGRKSLSNTAVRGTSISPLKIKMVAEDEEDPVLVGEEGEMALVVYNRSPELSITLPPLVPPKPDHRGSSEELSDRNKVKRTLRLFQFLTRKLLQEVESKKDSGRVRVDLKAVEILKKKNECVNSGRAILGHVPGVEIGDEFHYRVELSIVGLHRPYQGGIDFSKIGGMVLATSIVASGGYADVANSSDVLIYSGSGGNPVGGDKQAGDQKLERGNLALKNSIEAGTPVRVIHGFKEVKGSELDPKVKVVSTFAYDGLYVVEKYWTEKGRRGNSVFMFRLRRMGGQPELALKEVKRSRSKSKEREGLCIEDISERKETIPICAVNTIDDDKPMPFNYTTKNMYPSWHVHTLPSGCDCIFGCSDSNNCACAAKNGGEIPFNYYGAIVQAKPLVYECGPSCRCPPSCQNRVSQHGIRVPLEIFKTESRGWGVRSLHSMPSGSFICEYIGELLKDSEAEQTINDEYLFDIGHNYEDKTIWEGLPSLIPGLHASSLCDTVDDVGFTIDAAAYGNIGRFINHSCSPNIYAQNVLYDHDDKRMPHIMFFAADNIPPLQELTYHYNYTVDQVYDSEGNIKQKSCYCGAPDCTGRLY